MPPTVPTWPRGAIIEGIVHPMGAAADRPPIDRLIQNSALAAVCAVAAPKMPRPNAVPTISTVRRTLLASQPR